MCGLQIKAQDRRADADLPASEVPRYLSVALSGAQDPAKMYENTGFMPGSSAAPFPMQAASGSGRGMVTGLGSSSVKSLLGEGGVHGVGGSVSGAGAMGVMVPAFPGTAGHGLLRPLGQKDRTDRAYGEEWRGRGGGA